MRRAEAPPRLRAPAATPTTTKTTATMISGPCNLQMQPRPASSTSHGASHECARAWTVDV
jgi:hypothetical protein